MINCLHACINMYAMHYTIVYPQTSADKESELIRPLECHSYNDGIHLTSLHSEDYGCF